jgi:hypothetical protein
MQYQFYWSRWYMSWDRDPDEHFGIIHNTVVIGPLQMRFYSRPKKGSDPKSPASLQA